MFLDVENNCAAIEKCSIDSFLDEESRDQSSRGKI